MPTASALVLLPWSVIIGGQLLLLLFFLFSVAQSIFSQMEVLIDFQGYTMGENLFA